MTGIEVTGLEDLIDDTENMTITDSDEKKIMKYAIEPAEQEVNNNAPKYKGDLQKNIKATVKKVDFATIGQIKLGQWYSMFTEYGTSQSKAHVGWFERSINNTLDEVMARLADGLFEKVG